MSNSFGRQSQTSSATSSAALIRISCALPGQFLSRAAFVLLHRVVDILPNCLLPYLDRLPSNPLLSSVPSTSVQLLLCTAFVLQPGVSSPSQPLALRRPSAVLIIPVVFPASSSVVSIAACFNVHHPPASQCRPIHFCRSPRHSPLVFFRAASILVCFTVNHSPASQCRLLHICRSPRHSPMVFRFLFLLRAVLFVLSFVQSCPVFNPAASSSCCLSSSLLLSSSGQPLPHPVFVVCRPFHVLLSSSCAVIDHQSLSMFLSSFISSHSSVLLPVPVFIHL